MCNGQNHDHGHDHAQKGGTSQSIKVLFQPYQEKGMTEELRSKLLALETIPSERQSELLELLEGYIRHYPEVASLHGALASLYEANKELDKAEKCLQDALALFPKDILLRTAYAGFLLRKGEFERVTHLFNHTFDLQAAYPERDTFYALEVLEFYGVAGFYYAATGKAQEAYNCFLMVKRIDPKSSYARSLGDLLGIPSEDDPYFKNAMALLKKERTKVRFKHRTK